VGVVETILVALRAVPLIVEKLDDLSNAIKSVQNAKTDMELAMIKERLNALTIKLKTTTDKAELADIVRQLNSL
jgi:energy-coupling factor transporter transmembrane protein EcfT